MNCFATSSALNISGNLPIGNYPLYVLLLFITNYSKVKLENFEKIAEMSLKTAVLALPARVFFSMKYCHFPTENKPLNTYAGMCYSKKLTWTRFFELTITDDPRLARPAPRPPFQGPVSIACPNLARQTRRGRKKRHVSMPLHKRSRR